MTRRAGPAHCPAGPFAWWCQLHPDRAVRWIKCGCPATERGVMATLADPPVGPNTRHPRVPWSWAAWRQALFLGGGIPVQVAALAVIVVPIIVARQVIWVVPITALAAGVFLALPLLTW